MGSGRRPLPQAFRRERHPTTGHLAPPPKTEALHQTSRLQDFLADFHVEWEKRLTRWTLGVRHALEAGDALPPFPTATADSLGAVGPWLEGEALLIGRNGQGGTAGGAIASDHVEQRCHVRQTRGDP